MKDAIPTGLAVIVGAWMAWWTLSIIAAVAASFARDLGADPITTVVKAIGGLLIAVVVLDLVTR